MCTQQMAKRFASVAVIFFFFFFCPKGNNKDRHVFANRKREHSFIERGGSSDFRCGWENECYRDIDHIEVVAPLFEHVDVATIRIGMSQLEIFCSHMLTIESIVTSLKE